eukprot:scaffold18751_cov245-Isochrysis_galbana.AAC.2
MENWQSSAQTLVGLAGGGGNCGLTIGGRGGGRGGGGDGGIFGLAMVVHRSEKVDATSATVEPRKAYWLAGELAMASSVCSLAAPMPIAYSVKPAPLRLAAELMASLSVP